MTRNNTDIDQVIARQERRQQRLDGEARRVAEVKARGIVPDSCGPEIPAAPGRGAFRVVAPRALFPVGEDGFEARHAGYRGRDVMELQDVFGVMAAQAARRGKRLALTPGQISMGRIYRGLVERHAAAGVKCSSLETTGGSGQGGAFMDAVLRDRRMIEVLQRRIGTGVAMPVRRVRPSARGTRRSIGNRPLVDTVCLEGSTISEVLRSYGWAINGETVAAVTKALGACLDRMAGGGRRRCAEVYFAGGTPPAMIWQDHPSENI